MFKKPTSVEKMGLFSTLASITPSPPKKNLEAALLPRGRLGLRHPLGHPLRRHARPRAAGMNCIKISLPGKRILGKRKGLWEVIFP